MTQQLPYQYTESGLDNIYLLSGVHFRDTPYGRTISIEDVDGLHRVIAGLLVDKPAALTGKEFRFLRQFLGMSQKKLGDLFGLEDQTIAIWEKSPTEPPQLADASIRNMVREKVGGNPIVTRALELLAEAERQEYRSRLDLVKEDEWQKAA